MLKPLSASHFQSIVTAHRAASNTPVAQEVAPETPKDRADLSPNQPPGPVENSDEKRAADTVRQEQAPGDTPAPASSDGKDAASGKADLMNDLEVPEEMLSGIPPELVVGARDGKLLGKGAILKFDQYPTLQNPNLEEKLLGAPNFRQVKNTEMYGVAQPTIDGIRQVLDRTGAKDREVQWTNMREEPVIYINGRSFSLRELGHPLENSDDFQGQDGAAMDRTESQLKAEIMAEAEKFGGKLLIHDEDKEGKVVARWVDICESSVKTTQEVFDGLKAEGYKVDFARVPVTDEKTPQAGDLDALVDRIGGADPSTPMIFNCHAGRGRTTTAMVAAQLIQDAKRGAEQPEFQRQPAVRQDIREQGRYDRGEYRLILRLIQALDGGEASKSQTDMILDRTGDMQNLRTEIARYREKSLDPNRDEASRSRSEARGLDYLHRYHTLITFNEYVNENAKDGFKVSYSEWLKGKPELDEMLQQFELAFKTPTQVPGAESPVGYA